MILGTLIGNYDNFRLFCIQRNFLLIETLESFNNTIVASDRLLESDKQLIKSLFHEWNTMETMELNYETDTQTSLRKV